MPLRTPCDGVGHMHLQSGCNICRGVSDDRGVADS